MIYIINDSGDMQKIGKASSLPARRSQYRTHSARVGDFILVAEGPAQLIGRVENEVKFKCKALQLHDHGEWYRCDASTAKRIVIAMLASFQHPIYFTRRDDGNYDIWVLSDDGSRFDCLMKLRGVGIRGRQFECYASCELIGPQFDDLTAAFDALDEDLLKNKKLLSSLRRKWLAMQQSARR